MLDQDLQVGEGGEVKNVGQKPNFCFYLFCFYVKNIFETDFKYIFKIFERNLKKYLKDIKIICKIFNTRNLGCSMPLFLAPAVAWEPFGLPALCAPYGMWWAAGGPLGQQKYGISILDYTYLISDGPK